MNEAVVDNTIVIATLNNQKQVVEIANFTSDDMFDRHLKAQRLKGNTCRLLPREKALNYLKSEIVVED